MRIAFTYSAFAVLVLLAFSACKKEEGPGGNSSIYGKVWAKDYPTNIEYPAADRDVYIIYGDDVSYGDRVKTSYDGYFEFKYLRKGKYKIYTYSYAYTTLQDSAVKIDVEITSKKQKVETPTINVID